MLIGISGKKRSGKDTVADILMMKYPKSIKYYFAACLKMEVARACGVTVEYIDEHKDNFRRILQGWGTDFRRKLQDENYWIKKMEIAVQNFSSFKNIIIPDVRFKNEYDFVKQNGGIVIRVSRDTGAIDNHVSETELDKEQFDAVILNDSDFGHIVDQVLAIDKIK